MEYNELLKNIKNMKDLDHENHYINGNPSENIHFDGSEINVHYGRASIVISERM